MLKKILKISGLILLVYIVLGLVTPHNTFLRERSISNQINYLSKLVDHGYDDELQRRFPEGKLFSNCLLALSTIEYSDKYQESNKKYATIVDRCIKRILSEEALIAFDAKMTPAYGMFYNGWTNLVYTSYMKSSLFEYSEIRESVQMKSSLIILRLASIQSDSIRVLDSYRGSNWPADNMIGILSLNDDDLKKAWIKELMSLSNHSRDLIHHVGSNLSEVRGSSSAMISYCLSKMHGERSEQYNDRFKSLFVESFLGVQLVKEYEDGSNVTDVDSGPVLWGYGASATIMNIKTQASYDDSNARFTWGAMNLIALPINIFGRKSYLFKQEPMLDLFMLWASTEL